MGRSPHRRTPSPRVLDELPSRVELRTGGFVRRRDAQNPACGDSASVGLRQVLRTKALGQGAKPLVQRPDGCMSCHSDGSIAVVGAVVSGRSAGVSTLVARGSASSGAPATPPLTSKRRCAP